MFFFMLFFRLCVHMQKSRTAVYEERGFDMDDKTFIPPQYRREWGLFLKEHEKLNLWDECSHLSHVTPPVYRNAKDFCPEFESQPY